MQPNMHTNSNSAVILNSKALIFFSKTAVDDKYLSMQSDCEHNILPAPIGFHEVFGEQNMTKPLT